MSSSCQRGRCQRSKTENDVDHGRGFFSCLATEYSFFHDSLISPEDHRSHTPENPKSDRDPRAGWRKESWSRQRDPRTAQPDHCHLGGGNDLSDQRSGTTGAVAFSSTTELHSALPYKDLQYGVQIHLHLQYSQEGLGPCTISAQRSRIGRYRWSVRSRPRGSEGSTRFSPFRQDRLLRACGLVTRPASMLNVG